MSKQFVSADVRLNVGYQEMMMSRIPCTQSFAETYVVPDFFILPGMIPVNRRPPCTWRSCSWFISFRQRHSRRDRGTTDALKWQALPRERSIERVVGRVYSRSALGQRSQPTHRRSSQCRQSAKWRHVEFLRGLRGSPAWFASPKSTREQGAAIVMDSRAPTISQRRLTARGYRG